MQVISGYLNSLPGNPVLMQFKCPYSGSPFMDLPTLLDIFIEKDDGLILLNKELPSFV